MRKLNNDELGRISIDEFKNAEKIPILIILDNIRSLNNIGSVFRTADAFRIEKIILCGITAKPPNRDIHKTALGATESITWEYHEHTEDVVSALKKSNYKVYAIEQADQSVSLEKFIPDFKQKIALVFGNEVKGVKDEIITMVDNCIEIPQFGTKHSLNIAVSVGIVVWDLVKKLETRNSKLET